MRRLALVAALLLAACTAVPAPDSTSAAPSPSAAAEIANGHFDGARAKAHVSYLADPARGGRMSGSAGYADAAQYVADRFREIGLEPLGDNGTYFQHFPMPNVELAAMPTLAAIAPSARTYKARVDMTETVGGRSGRPARPSPRFATRCARGVPIRPRRLPGSRSRRRSAWRSRSRRCGRSTR